MTARQLQTVARRWLLCAVKKGVSAATEMEDEHYRITWRSYWRLKETEWNIYRSHLFFFPSKSSYFIILKMCILRINVCQLTIDVWKITAIIKQNMYTKKILLAPVPKPTSFCYNIWKWLLQFSKDLSLYFPIFIAQQVKHVANAVAEAAPEWPEYTQIFIWEISISTDLYYKDVKA